MNENDETSEKPRTFQEAIAAVNAMPAPEPEPDEPETEEEAEIKAVQVPDWIVLPDGFKFPEEIPIGFMRFRAKTTSKPSLGDRQCIMWELSPTDEKLASQRAARDPQRAIFELAKQTIRVIDGRRVDWTKGLHSNVEKFWTEIGPRNRSLVMLHYTKTHQNSPEDLAVFFQSCYVVGSMAGG